MQLTEEMRKWRAAGLSYRAIAAKVGKNKKTVQIAFGAAANHGKVRQVEGVPARVPKPAADIKLKGLQMTRETRVSIRRPATSIRSRFFELKRGQAFAVDMVAREWGISADTLRTHARDAECFLYVDMGNEKWVPCVMHPDTAKQYNAR